MDDLEEKFPNDFINLNEPEDIKQMERKSKKNCIKIYAFGVVAEKMNTNCVSLENIHNTATLKNWLNVNYPELKDLKLSVAVNKNIVHSDVILNNGDEIALLPPFSGG